MTKYSRTGKQPLCDRRWCLAAFSTTSVVTDTPFGVLDCACGIAAGPAERGGLRVAWRYIGIRFNHDS